MTGATVPRSSSMRGDIEGLRAVAVLMVLLYHARIPAITGGFAGVDVFFVISGFLITSLLVREVHRDGRISLPTFYARRARRLLPAATVVLVFSGLAGLAVLPTGAWGALGRNILASTFYVVNWSLAGQSVDYLAEDATPSAVQHYWSLSVEEQFYVFWPLVMIAAVWVAARTRRSRFRYMAGVLGGITIASFVWSVVATQQDPGTAYFVSTTRVWELGFGALLTFGVTGARRLPRLAAELLALGGVGAILTAAVWVSTATPWPGSAALLPVAGTTAVIAAGCAHADTRTGRALGVAPMRFIGGISYSLYLWHWPLLVFMDQVRPGTGLRGRIAVLGLAVALAYLSKVLVEDPIRFRRSLAVSPARALSWGAAGMLASSVVATTVILSAPSLDSDIPSWASGATALMDDPTADRPVLRPDVSTALTDQGRVYPAPDLAPEDVPALYDDGCQSLVDDAEVLTCDYGDTESERVVAVVGDSKVGQWLPALDVIGRQEGWLIRTYTKSACPLSDVNVTLEGEPYDTCRQWNDRVMAELTRDQPFLVVTSDRSSGASRKGSADGSDALVAGYVADWQRLEDAGVGVIALADNPHPGTQVYRCVGEHPDDFTVCDFPVGEGRGTSSLREASDQIRSAELVDLTSWLCPTEECPAVIGNVLIYRQGSHITATYVETLAPVLRAALLPAARSVLASTGG
ncbi:MAG: acyltransferase family protein [Ornithinimicrobium sp.]